MSELQPTAGTPRKRASSTSGSESEKNPKRVNTESIGNLSESQFSGMRLMPKGAEQVSLFETFGIGVSILSEHFKINDTAILSRIFHNLSGLIVGDQICPLGSSGIATPLALTIIQLHATFQVMIDAERKILDIARARCVKESTTYRGTLFYYLNKFALLVGNFIMLRLDEEGYLSCNGDRSKEAQFLGIGVCPGDTVELWFCFPSTRRHIVSANMPVMTLSQLDACVDFSGQGTWAVAALPRTAMIRRAILMKTNPCMIKGAPSSSVARFNCFDLATEI
jgi:hypothetical protein